MGICETCGNDYEKCFEVKIGGATHVFDSFECAIESLAPRCSHCDCRIIGHGVEIGQQYFCCDHCVRQTGQHVSTAHSEVGRSIES